MRKIKTVFLLSVMILSVAGCAAGTAKESADVEKMSEMKESSEQVSENDTKEATTEVKPEVTNVTNVTNQPSSEVESKKSEEQETFKRETPKAEMAPETEHPKEEGTKTPEPKQEETKPSVSPEDKPVEPEKPSAVAYDPNQVRSLAISKCQAGGMITTEDNLAKNLAEGKITHEEYNEYYPLDGLEGSYYSVFVETDLNQASTTSGRKLGSVDGIAQYIADMLLLEQDPLFNITYAGVVNKGGTDFYEFRCHR